MKKGMMIFLILVLTLIFTFSFVSASFTIGNLSNSIEKQYSPSDFIKGWINISLNNEPTSSLFETNFGDSISLIDLIKLNTISYSCIPIGCGTDYSVVANSEQAKKNFNLNAGQSENFGLKISSPESFQSASDFSLNVTSNVQQFDFPQLYIDILNDDGIEWQSYKPANNFKPKNYGCYQGAEGQGIITYETPYCEKITLPPTPNVTIGAEVIATPGGTVPFIISITEKDGGYDGQCEATATANGSISCSPANFKTTQEKDFFVCIKAKNSGDNNNYSINFESNTVSVCGFSGTYTGSYNIDFEIFARPDRFARVGSFILNNAELEKFGSNVNIGEYISQYINNKYNNNCSSDCVIPIKFIAGENQNINISDFKLKVQTNVVQWIDKTYNVTETPAKITSGFQKLYLDKANFSVPDDFGNHTFSLTLNGQEIFSEKISIEKIPQIISLTPKVVMAAYPTEFKVIVETFNFEIASYKWNFGNGDIKTTTENKIVYAYPALGKYNLTITITTSTQLNSSKTFTIESTSPKQAVNSVLGKKLSDFSNLKIQIGNLPSFYQDSLKSVLNLSAIENKLTELQRKNATATSDQDYVDIMKELIELEFPQAIITTAKADSLPFYPAKENINLDVLKEIGGGNYSARNKDKYIDAVLAWNLENLETKIDFERISAVNEDFEGSILNVFNIKIEKKNATSSPYLIIQKLENLRFKEDYSKKEVLDFFYIPLTSSKTTVTFSTTEEVDFVDIPAFISPKISELSVGEIVEEKLKKGVIIVIVIGILIFGFAAYILLQEWYKRKYETYLFKNRNYLYNLAIFVQNSKKSGMEDKEIISKLKKAGWKSEQIRYVMKKYAGKRTGMFEIPIGKIFSIFKKKSDQYVNIPRQKFNYR